MHYVFLQLEARGRVEGGLVFVDLLRVFVSEGVHVSHHKLCHLRIKINNLTIRVNQSDERIQELLYPDKVHLRKDLYQPRNGPVKQHD